MPIRPEHRFLYPIDWRQISAMIRFGRAAGRCERCGRPHGASVLHPGDGRWYDEALGHWRDDRGRRRAGPDRAPRQLGLPGLGGAPGGRRMRVVLASAHLDHDPGNNRPANLAALCQRCHLAHDRAEHRRQRWRTLFRRRALGDLFLGPYR